MTKLGFDVTDVPNLQRDLVKIAEYDLPNNGYGYETGFAAVKLNECIAENTSIPFLFLLEFHINHFYLG
jgi:hypothetical protein